MAVEGFAVTKDNFKEAVKLLERRFGNTQVIVNSHMEELSSIAAVNSKDDTVGLRTFHDKVEMNLRSLHSLGVDPDNYGSLLVPMLKKKIPNEVVLLLSRQFDSNVTLWKINDMMKELLKEIEARERCFSDKDTKHHEKSNRRTNNPTTTESLVANSNKLECPYCSKGHYPDQCKVVTNPVRRKEILVEKKKCFVCTRGQHSAMSCKARRMCVKCGGKHHTSICDPSISRKKDVPEKPKDDQNKSKTGDEESGLVAKNGEEVRVEENDNEKNVLLQTMRVELRNPKKPVAIMCRVVLDLCCQRTYITKRVRQFLDLPEIEVTDPISVSGFGGHTTARERRSVVEVGLQRGKSEVIYVKAVAVDVICSPISGQNIDIAKEEYVHLYGLPLADDGREESVQIELLIGADFYWNIVLGDVVRGNKGPVAMKTRFGYVLSGRSRSLNLFANEPSPSLLTTSLIASGGEEDMTSQLHKFWDLESIGIRKEISAVQAHRNDIGFNEKDGKYEVSQVWKPEHEMLGDNFLLAKRRTISSIRRLQEKNPELLQEYWGIMNSQLENRVLEVVTQRMKGEVGRTYYVPPQIVLRPDKKTTKVRVVYDFSSKMAGSVSANECWEVPDAMFTDLFAIMVRFRLYLVGLIADIEKAFLMIQMKEEDRDAQRLIWVKDPFAEELEFVILRFTTVTFGAGPSMWHLGSTIQHHVSKYEDSYPETVMKIIRSLYADDFSGGGNSVESAVKLYTEARQIFKEAGMNLRKWNSNSEEVMKQIKDDEDEPSINQDEESYAEMMLNPGDPSPVKVLGSPWDVKKDVFRLSLEKIIERKNDVRTKRSLVSVSYSIYDVLGVLSPMIFALKVLFQRACKEGGGWDDPLSTNILDEWNRWVAGAERCSIFEIPRCYDLRLADKDSVLMLIGFSDASKKGFAAAVYLRVESREGVSVNLIASKTRVAPLQEQTIPRLELLGALILSRLMKRIRDIFQHTVHIEKEYCFTDSAVALHWKENWKKEYKQYVQDRAKEIRIKSASAIWRHVPGKENPADLPSRGCTPDQFEKKKNFWLHGPEWLLQEESTWPTRRAEELELSEDQKRFADEELKIKKDVKKAEVALMGTEHDVTDYHVEKIINPERYSSLMKLLRVTAICMKFIAKCKKTKDWSNEVDADDIKSAKGLWLKYLQREVQKDGKFKKVAESLGVKKDANGFLRCHGRMGRMKLPFDVNHPLLLPTHHWVTSLIIWECHERVYHDGVRETLTELRSKYWIPKGRQRVKMLLKKCCLCKLIEGLAYPEPSTADLPEFRLDGGRTFKYTGVDFCGPVYVKNIYRKEKENKELDGLNKAYILKYTCATSRMVHLELCPDLYTDTYIRAQERFTERKGRPMMILSDNGKTFKGKQLKKFNAAKGIRWRFNLARASWWGGLFERLVRSTKRCLKKAVGSRRMTFEELQTEIIKIEAVLNSRPLTYIYEKDLAVPVTPEHLHRGERTLDNYDDSDSSEIPEEFDLTREDAIAAVQKRASVVDHFWCRWQKEYLADLREVHQRHVQKKDPDIRIGDVVLIGDKKVKRCKWKLGKVIELVKGRDGVVRGAVLETEKERQSRPLQKLYPLEVRDQSMEKKTDTAAPDGDDAAPVAAADPVAANDSVAADDPVADDDDSVAAAGDDLVTAVAADPVNVDTAGSRPRRRAGADGQAKRRAVERK